MFSDASEPCYVSRVTENFNDLAVGIDFGGTKVLGAIVDQRGNIVAEQRVPTPYDGESLLNAIAGLVNSLEEEAKVTSVGVGVGAAGLVDRDGVLHYGPNVGGVTNVDVQGGIQKRLPNHKVRVDNDANAATWGECLFGAGRRTREMAMITLGTGIGGGIITSGKLFRGEAGFAAEFGHMTIEHNGVMCSCGKHGCWEAYASGRALGRLGREAAADAAFERGIELAGHVDNVKGEHVTAAARMGDAAALAVLDDFSKWLATGMATLIAFLDPQLIVVGGGLAEDSDLYLETTKKYLDNVIFGNANRPPVEVAVATLGERAGAVGAAMLVHGDSIPEV